MPVSCGRGPTGACRTPACRQRRLSLPGSLHFLPRSHHREFESDGADLDVLIMFLDDERIDFSLSDRAQRELWVPSLVEIINIVCREAIALGFSSAALLEYCKEILVIKLLREPLKEESVPGGAAFKRRRASHRRYSSRNSSSRSRVTSGCPFTSRRRSIHR